MIQSIVRDRGEQCRRQLGVSGRVFQRVRILVLGDSGTGKTTLVESLKCGYIRSLFRRSGATTLAAQAKGTYGPSTYTSRLMQCVAGITTLVIRPV